MRGLAPLVETSIITFIQKPILTVCEHKVSGIWVAVIQGGVGRLCVTHVSNTSRYAQKKGVGRVGHETRHDADGRERPAFERVGVSCKFLCSAPAQI